MQFVLSMAITLTFVLTMFQCDHANLAIKDDAANATVQPAKQDDGAPRITLAEAKADYDAGRAIFVDSRGAESYKAEHIKGAINIPFGNEAQYKNIPTDKKIIVYCS